jgi:hypothetical protein
MRIQAFLLTALLVAAAFAAPTIKLYRNETEVKYFHPQDHKLAFKADLGSMKLGQTKIKWKFLAVEVASGENGLIKEVEASGMVANQATGSLSLPSDWPYGNYKVELYVNGKLVATQPYVVSPEVKDLKATAHALFADDGKGGRGARLESFTPANHKQHFGVQVNGFFMGKAEAHWKFIAVDTPVGKNQLITEMKSDVSNTPGDTLTAHVELPQDWPVGKYRAEVSLNGRPLDTINYEVK